MKVLFLFKHLPRGQLCLQEVWSFGHIEEYHYDTWLCGVCSCARIGHIPLKYRCPNKIGHIRPKHFTYSYLGSLVYRWWHGTHLANMMGDRAILSWKKNHYFLPIGHTRRAHMLEDHTRGTSNPRRISLIGFGLDQLSKWMLRTWIRSDCTTLDV